MIPLELVQDVINKSRPCGPCTVCCTVMGVVELSKPYYTKCKSESGRCTIYRNRPESCSGFECGWRMNLFGTNDIKLRPDKSGIVVSVDTDDNGDWLEIFESRKGALVAFEDFEKFVDTTIENVGGLRGVRIYPFNAQIALQAPLSTDYPNNGLVVRNFLSMDGIHYVYDENGSKDGPIA